jgi:dTMP kinase
LWVAQVISAVGDWLGFVAIVAVATRISGSAGAISLVMSARLIPGFFLAPVAGVLVDRLDRKKIMVACDLVRAAVLFTIPFVNAIWQLVIASLVLEVATLLWSPAKEASVPNLVPASHLTTANSLSLVAAYGTFPIATLLFALLAKVADWLGDVDVLDVLPINQESVALYVDVATFALSALFISTLALPPRRPAATEAGEAGQAMKMDLGQTGRELKEGWSFMVSNPVVRAVMVAIGTGLIGGGMLVPLGDLFSRQVLGGGSAGFGLLLTALGSGLAAGVILISVLQKRLPKVQVFCGAVVTAGVTLVLGATMSTLPPAIAFVFVLGMCAGTIYVLGFTILQERVVDELRGRVFASLYTLVRLCVLLAFAAGPLLADRLEALSQRAFDGSIDVAGLTVAIPGVRLALWFAGVIIIAAGVLAVLVLRRANDAPVARPA